MALDFVVFGTLALGAGDMSAWERVVVDPARYRTIGRVFPAGADLAAVTVGALLRAFPAAGGYDLFRIDQEGELHRVRGQFAERPFRRYARHLAALFMCAAEVGIEGDVYFLGQGVREGYALELSGGRSTLGTLEDEEIGRRSRDPMLDAISAHFRVARDTTAPASSRVSPSSAPRALLEFPVGKASAREDGPKKASGPPEEPIDADRALLRRRR
jgi:hypothetical protein